MKLNNREFDVPDHLFEEFFTCMDGFEKVILSNDQNPKKVTKEDKEKYTIYSVADHIFALPKGAVEALSEFIVYLDEQDE